MWHDVWCWDTAFQPPTSYTLCEWTISVYWHRERKGWDLRGERERRGAVPASVNTLTHAWEKLELSCTQTPFASIAFRFVNAAAKPETHTVQVHTQYLRFMSRYFCLRIFTHSRELRKTEIFKIEIECKAKDVIRQIRWRTANVADVEDFYFEQIIPDYLIKTCVWEEMNELIEVKAKTAPEHMFTECAVVVSCRVFALHKCEEVVRWVPCARVWWRR